MGLNLLPLHIHGDLQIDDERVMIKRSIMTMALPLCIQNEKNSHLGELNIRKPGLNVKLRRVQPRDRKQETTALVRGRDSVQGNIISWKSTMARGGLPSPGFTGSIGKKGSAPIGRKKEGDGETPSGIYSLGTAFGYYPSVETKMPYREAADEDY